MTNQGESSQEKGDSNNQLPDAEAPEDPSAVSPARLDLNPKTGPDAPKSEAASAVDELLAKSNRLRMEWAQQNLRLQALGLKISEVVNEALKGRTNKPEEE